MAHSSSAPTQTRAGRSAGIGFIMLTVLIDMVSIGLIIPVLPALVGSFTKNATEQALWYGVVAFAFGFANFLSAPVLGALSDQYGRRPVLLIGFCGLALNFFTTAFATSLALLVGVRLIGGAMQANAAVANAYVADISSPEERAKRFGMLGAMFGMGFILGPVMGGLLGAISLRLPFFVAGCLAICNWLYGFFVLPESLPIERRHKINWRAANPVSSLRKLTLLKGGGVLVVMLALAGLAQFLTQTTWVLYTGLRFGWGPREAGWSLFAVGVVSVVAQGYLLKHILRRMGPRRLVVAGLLSGCVAYALFGLANQGWMMYAIICGNVLSFGVAAAIQSLISNSTDASNQGQALGALSSLNSLVSVIAPALGGPLMATVSHLPHDDWRVGVPYFFCAVLQLVAALLAVRYMMTHRVDSSSSATASLAGAASGAPAHDIAQH